MDEEQSKAFEERLRKVEAMMRHRSPELNDAQIAYLVDCIRRMMAPEWEKVVCLKPPIAIKKLAEKLGTSPFRVLYDLLNMNVFVSGINDSFTDEAAVQLILKFAHVIIGLLCRTRASQDHHEMFVRLAKR